MNKETLKEAAEKYRKTTPNQMFGDELGFIAGAKWQQKRMYSEEEVDKLLDRLLENNMCSHAGDELIEQFKK